MKKSSIYDVKVPVQIVLGETELSVKEISELSPGSIVRVDSIVGEPVVFLAAGEEITRGEVVVIDESLGLRILSMESK